MKTSSVRIFVIGAMSALSLAACGGGGTASISGTVSGLVPGLNLTLQDNGADSVTVAGNQAFAFPTGVGAGAAYGVTVLTQPTGETCSVANGTGVVDLVADDVSNVAVTCATTSSVGGTVSGLAAGTSLTLTNNGQALPLATNGVFAFPGTLAAGTSYQVTVSVQPVGETCTVANAAGTVQANVVANVAVTCS